MRDRRFTIVSTASLPFERMAGIPESADIRVVPFIKIIPVSGVELKLLITGLSIGKKNIVFTSAHAVKIVGEYLKNKPDWTIYCIRHETRVSVEKLIGNSSDIRFAGDARTLSDQMIADGIRQAVFFCGDQRMDILPDNLKNHGVILEEISVYETRLTPVYLPEIPDALLFFSPTAVRSFFSANELAPETALFAMGTTTAKALKSFTDHPVFISPEADKVYVLQMALKYAASHPIL